MNYRNKLEDIVKSVFGRHKINLNEIDKLILVADLCSRVMDEFNLVSKTEGWCKHQALHRNYEGKNYCMSCFKRLPKNYPIAKYNK